MSPSIPLGPRLFPGGIDGKGLSKPILSGDIGPFRGAVNMSASDFAFRIGILTSHPILRRRRSSVPSTIIVSWGRPRVWRIPSMRRPRRTAWRAMRSWSCLVGIAVSGVIIAPVTGTRILAVVPIILVTWIICWILQGCGSSRRTIIPHRRSSLLWVGHDLCRNDAEEAEASEQVPRLPAKREYNRSLEFFSSSYKKIVCS